MVEATSGTGTTTITFPRLILIISSIRHAYQKIMLYSDDKSKKWVDAFKEKQLGSVTFLVLTKLNGEKRKLVELEIAIDWSKYEEQIKLLPDVLLSPLEEHKQGIAVSINESVETFLELYDYAKNNFSDCFLADQYSYSQEVKSDKKLLDLVRKKLGLSPGKFIKPYSDATGSNDYTMKEIPELTSTIKTYF